jgi:hypothetical protein
MDITLRLSVLLVGIVILLITAELLRRGRIPVKFSLLWLVAVLLILFVALFPGVLGVFANLIGFQTISNMVVGVILIILILLTIAITVIISGQTTKIQILIQELSMLEKRLEEVEKEKQK